jgi:hypothetical protein
LQGGPARWWQQIPPVGAGDSLYDERWLRPGAPVTRANIGKPPGLTWPQTCVLKAACGFAMTHWDRRLTVNQIEEPLALLGITRAAILDALDALTTCGYLFVDDAPENFDVVLQVTSRCLDEYVYRFVPGHSAIVHRIRDLVCRVPQSNVIGLAEALGQPELLVEHVLDRDERAGLLRLARHGYSIVVKEVRPQLRRLAAGVA